jgi:hypothetical protein
MLLDGPMRAEPWNDHLGRPPDHESSKMMANRTEDHMRDERHVPPMVYCKG